MADVQLENGYLKIATSIYEAFAKIRIAGEARQVLDVIIRKTYGWGKKEDIISLSQFCLATGMSKTRICQGLKKLTNMNIIITEKGNTKGNKYKLNKDFTKWKSLPKKETLPKKEIAIAEKGNLPLPKIGHTIDTTKTIDTTTIDKNKYKAPLQKEKTATVIVVPESINSETWDHYLDMRKKIRKPATLKAQELIISKLQKWKEEGKDPNRILEQSIENSWQGIFELKEKPKTEEDRFARLLKEMEDKKNDNRKNL